MCAIVVDRCYMCKRNGLFVDHLLLHYEVFFLKFFIMKLLVLFGMFSSVVLGCLRLCIDK